MLFITVMHEPGSDHYVCNAIMSASAHIELVKLSDVTCRAEFEGYSDDESVRVVMSGNQEPKSVDITETAIEQGADVSSDRGC